ncbi:dihydroneopterin aldolase [bacterium]|nr:dihydroneopterin aldolase [bacterium]
MSFECELGFHPYEKKIRQKITLDLEVGVYAIDTSKKDDIDAIKMDYFEANQMLGKLFESRRYNLLETVAEDVAELLLHNFSIVSVLVKVTKYPLEMPNVPAVSYVCFRKK